MNTRVGMLERMREAQHRGIHPWEVAMGIGCNDGR